jgi:hypothetical protein
VRQELIVLDKTGENMNKNGISNVNTEIKDRENVQPPNGNDGDGRLDEYREVRLAKFEFNQLPGERPTPIQLMALEYRSGRRVQLCPLPPRSPYPLGPEVLFVTYNVPHALACHLALGWPIPANLLDLQAEFRCLSSGLLESGDYGMNDALHYLGVRTQELSDKPLDALAKLLETMVPQINLPLALLRGRYAAAVARMESLGVPIDVQSLTRLRTGWEWIQDRLIEELDQPYGVYEGRKLNRRSWSKWLNRNRIKNWPRHKENRAKLMLDLDTFSEMAEHYPQIRGMKELRASLSLLKGEKLAVGQDGRNRTSLRPFASKTGRNQPSTTKFIFGSAAWLRGLIKPSEGMALAYVDYEQQEFGIAGALSQDEAMMKAYRSGDPYLTFAKQAGAVPPDATKASHGEQREQFKHCALGVQYGMQGWSLAARLGIPVAEAKKLLRLHRKSYPIYWRWSDAVVEEAKDEGELEAAFGWMLKVGTAPNRRSLRNFPLQANGGEMLRLACTLLTENGVRVCAPVHDAVLIEAPQGEIDATVDFCKQVMAWASEQVLAGFTLRTEAKIVRYPNRYTSAKGQEMWNRVFRLIEQLEEKV